MDVTVGVWYIGTSTLVPVKLEPALTCMNRTKRVSGFMLAITGLPRRALFLSQAFSKCSHVFGGHETRFHIFTNDLFDTRLWIPRSFRMTLSLAELVRWLY